MSRLLYSSLCGLMAMATVRGQPYVVSEKYDMSNSNYVFTDINGELSDILEYEIEILVRGLGFGEGPKWIQDCSYINNGYMLMADQFFNCIFKYWAVDEEGTYDVECIRELPGDKPNAIAWNLNFPDEIYVALQDGNAVVRLALDDGLTELNRWDQSVDGEPLYAVNDITMDSQGNAYFTNWPAFFSDPDIVAGTWTIPRATMEVELVEQLTYGTNGIALTLDDSLLVVANTMDFPVGTFNGGDADQADFDNIFWRGYENDGGKGKRNAGRRKKKRRRCARSDNDFSAESAFYYLRATSAPDYFNSVNAHDGCAFDFEDHYWQSLIDGQTAEGYALITDAVTYGDDEKAIIGRIDFTGTGSGPTNFAKGMDGYMYATLTQWNDGGWGTGGVLARFKLKNYLTNEKDGKNSCYVMDCSDSSSSSSSSEGH